MTLLSVSCILSGLLILQLGKLAVVSITNAYLSFAAYCGSMPVMPYINSNSSFSFYHQSVFVVPLKLDLMIF